MYDFDVSEHLENTLKKLSKKDKELYTQVLNVWYARNQDNVYDMLYDVNHLR